MGDLDGVTNELRQELVELLAKGRKVEAIKRYREATGVGLAEAKSAVESFDPPADPSLLTERVPVRPSSGCAGAVVSVVVLSLALGCITSAKVEMMTEREFPPSNEVMVLRHEPEDRSFEVIATLRLDLARYDEKFAISRFKKRAMEIGADAIIVRDPQTRDIPGAYLPAEPGRDVMSVTGGSRRVLVTAVALRFGE